jgi:hypothetical protein
MRFVETFHGEFMIIPNEDPKQEERLSDQVDNWTAVELDCSRAGGFGWWGTNAEYREEVQADDHCSS